MLLFSFLLADNINQWHRVFILVMCGRAGWHCSQSLEPKPDKQTERQKWDFHSERHCPLARDEKTVKCFFFIPTLWHREIHKVCQPHVTTKLFCMLQKNKSWNKSLSHQFWMLRLWNSLFYFADISKYELSLKWWFALHSPEVTCQTVFFTVQSQCFPSFSVDTVWLSGGGSVFYASFMVTVI